MSSCCVTAAVPKSSHYGFFGILKHKLGLSGARHKKQQQEELATPGPPLVLESPQVVRIRCEEGVETIGDIQGSPVVIRRKVGVMSVILCLALVTLTQSCCISSVSHV